MKSVRLALMPLLLGACAVHINAGGGSAPPPAPRPVAVAQPPQPRLAPAAPPPVAAQPPTSRLRGQTHIAPAPTPPPDVVNTVRLKSLAARNAKGCGTREIAPNVYARIDCHDYNPIASAVPHTSTRKLKLVRSKQTVVRLKRRTSPAPVPQTVAGHAPPAGAAAFFEKDDAPLPDSIDLNALGSDGPIKNQLLVGSCTAFSLSTAMDNALMRVAARNAAGAPKVVSPIDVWAQYGTPQMDAAAEGVKGKSITDVDHWQYSGTQACKLVRNPMYDDCNESYGVMPGTWQADPVITQSIATAKQAGIVTLTKIESFKTLPADMDELTTALRSGSAIWAAMKIDGSVWVNKAMKDGVIPDWSSPNGGHAIAITGYRKAADGSLLFLIHNSWGTSWGQNGRAWVSQKMINERMHYAYRVHIEGDDVQPTPVAPTPPTPGQPTPPQPQPGGGAFPLSDDDCDGNSLVDLAVMKCAPMCPDDTRPFGGQCGLFGAGGH